MARVIVARSTLPDAGCFNGGGGGALGGSGPPLIVDGGVLVEGETVHYFQQYVYLTTHT